MKISVLLLADLFILTIFFSCHAPNKQPVQPQYFDEVISSANSLYSPDREKFFFIVDSVYNTLPDPSIKDQCKRYDFKSHYFFEKGEFTKSFSYTDSILMIIKKNNLEKELAEFYGNACFVQGDIFMELKNYNYALKYYYDGERYLTLTRDTCLYSRYSGRLASICYKQGQYLEAAHYFIKVVNEVSYCSGDKKLYGLQFLQGNLDNAGLSYDKCGMYDSAIYCYNQALDYIAMHENEYPDEKVSTEAARGIIYGNLGTVYFEINRIKDAEALFIKSIAINGEKGYVNGDAQLTRVKLAELYLQTSRLKEAHQVLKQIKDNLNELFPQLKLRMYRVYSKYYIQSDKPYLAINSMHEYIALKDSLDLDERKLITTDFNKGFENITQQYQISALENKNKAQSNYFTLAVIVAALAIIVTIFIILLLITRLRVRKQKATLEHLEAVIEGEEKERGRIARELHDGSISELSAIKMKLLSLPTQYPQIDEASGNFQNILKQLDLSISGIRITSRNLIPDILQKQTLEEAVTELCYNMLGTIKIKFRSIEPLPSLPKKFELTVYRIIQELINNIVKHAGATYIYIQFNVTEYLLVITIEDNGKGIPKDKWSKGKGIGLFNLEWRLTLLRGKMVVETSNGTSIYLEIPLKNI